MKAKGEFERGFLRIVFRKPGALHVCLLLLCLAVQSSAQSYKILHAFGTNAVGMNPYSALAQGPDGLLYGTAEEGGSANKGEVFKINPDGTGYTALKDFSGPDGAWPEAGLVISDTTLYGTTGGGGTNNDGTIFKINTDGSGFTVLKHFTGYDGSDPYAKLLLVGTVLYGTTAGGGAFWDGTVFRINTDGSGYAALKHFTGNIDGAWPYGSLVLAGSTLYGTASGGGTSGNGTVFKVNTDGSGYEVLKHFTGGYDGNNPSAGLVLSGANLYGTAFGGGTYGNGTVFKLNTDGSAFSVLKHFTALEGAGTCADLVLIGTTLYGTTSEGGSSGYGTVFKLKTDVTGFMVLKDFTNSIEGANSYAGLLLSDSTLYGSTYCGGANGCGSIFKLQTDGSDFSVLTSFVAADGLNPAGELLLSGTNFYGATWSGGAAGMGTIFRVNPDGSGYTVLKEFTNSMEGANPKGGLVLSGSTLYGAADGGSAYGVIFKINTDGTGYTVLKDFTNQLEGAYPNGSLALSENILYGTTRGGGSNDYGAVFSLNTDGSGFTVLHSFSIVVWNGPGTNADGAWPQSGLVLAGGTLYGTASGGGTNGYGTVFKLGTDGTDFSPLKHFAGTDSAYPSGRLTFSSGALYGTTAYGGGGNGTIFKLNTDGSGFAVLRTFSITDGGALQGGLLICDPLVYGTAGWGGSAGYGTLFQLGTDGSNFSVLKHFTGSDGSSPNEGLVLAGTTLFGAAASGSTSEGGVLFSLSLLPGAPEIQLQPQSQTAHLHWTVNFVVAAGGIPAPSYQWFFNGNVIDGATNGLFQLADVQGTQAGAYWTVVTNSYGSVTSAVATLTVEDPFLDYQPGSQYAKAGDTVSFNVGAGGTEPLAIQWLKDGTSLTDGGNLSGAQTRTLTLTNVTGGDAGWFSVLVTNSYGSVISVPVMLVVQDPYINGQPSDQFVNVGDTAQFSVDAGGTRPLGYQWLKGGVSLSDSVNISGSQTATLILSNIAAADAGGYSVTVSNAQSTVPSVTAQLVVNQALADSFNPGADAGVAALAIQADGKVLVGGWFGSLGQPWRSALGRLNIDGTTDLNFNPAFQGAVSCLGVLPDGKILVGGDFIPPGHTNLHLARLEPNGTLDPTFQAEVDSTVEGMAFQPDGKVLLGGDFTMLDGQTNYYLGRLNADGTLDTTFTCQVDGVVGCFAVQPDGKIIVGGGFSTLDGEPRYNIARLNADGTLDMTFNPGASSGVCSLVLQSDGKILAAGDFMTLGGRDAYHLGRLNPDGTPDRSFNAQADADVVTLAVRADGKIVLGGWFSTLNSQRRHAVGQLNADGSLDTTFNPGAEGAVRSLAVQSDGKILLGGEFGTLAGQPRNNLGRLNNPEPANENLTFDGSTITWLRGGSAPEVWRTSFVVSTNGARWLTLGDGTRIAGGWQLTGISASPTASLGALGFVPGSGLSSWFVETLTGAPAVVTQPESATRLAGADVSFRVLAGGTPPIAYQWFKGDLLLSDGANISGAHGPTLALTNVFGADAGAYFVIVSNVFGSVTSVVATLTVQDPFIMTQPFGQTVLLSSNATFRAQAVGTAPLAYQWRHDGTNLVDTARITGSQQPTLAIASVQSSDAGDYHLIVSNTFGQTISSTATMTVITRYQLPLVYDIQAFIDGRDQLVFRGDTLQWFHYDNAAVGRWEGHNEPTLLSTSMGGQPILTNVAWVPTWPEPPPAEIRYPTNSSLFAGLAPAMPAGESLDITLTAVSVRGAVTVVQTPSATNAFSLIIEFDDNPIGGADWYHILIAVSPPTPEPIISAQPQSSTNAAGTDARFSVIATGAPPLGYQWFKGGTMLSDGGNVSGAQRTTLTLSNVFGTDTGAYFVIVSNMYGSVTSQVATLTVVDPYIAAQPINQSVNAGGNVHFNVSAGGTLPFGYQWLKNGGLLSDSGNVSGVHTATLRLSSVLHVDQGGYSVRVTNAYGSVTSVVAVLSVADPFIASQPASQTVIAGQSAAFSVTAVGTPPLSYQWRKNGAALSRKTSSTLGFRNVQLADAGNYDVVVSNAAATLQSATAILTVRPRTPGDIDLTFDPGSTVNSPVYAIGVQPDGKVLIGGDFTTVHGIKCGGVARLNSDGSTDPTFGYSVGLPYPRSLALQSDGRIVVSGLGGIVRLNSDGSADSSFVTSYLWSIDCLAIQSDGKILIAGSFTSVGGTACGRIARLNADGTLDGSFLNGLSGADAEVRGLVLETDGKVVIVGDFTSVNGVTRNRVARLNPDGSLDGSLGDSAVDASVLALAVASDGKILIGGWFTNVAGVVQSKLARLNPDGSRDASFAPVIAGQPNYCAVASLSLQPDGKVLFGGYFWTVNGVNHDSMARLNADGSLDNSFQGSTMSNPYTLALQGDGKILVGGWIIYADRAWTVARDGVARLNADGSADLAFGNGPAGPNGHINSLAIQNDGRVLIAGQFRAVNWVNHGGVARLNPDGSLDTSFLNLPGVTQWPDCLALQPDGKVFIGGYGYIYSGRLGLGRLNPDGSLDSAFAPSIFANFGAGYSPSVHTLALQTDGKIVIGGYFTSVNSIARTNLARLNPSGTTDMPFQANLSADPSISQPISCLAVQSDGKILVGGRFTNVNGVARANLVRLNTNGSLDNTFVVVLAGLGIEAIALQSDGKVLIGGSFTNVNGVSRPRLARLNPDGSLDGAFLNGMAGPSWTVNNIAPRDDGKVFITGDFGAVNGVWQSGCACLNPDGSLDTSFAPVLGRGQFDQGSPGSCLAFQPDGKILLGGAFSVVNDVPCRSLVRLIGSYAAPVIGMAPQTQTAEEGSALCLSVAVTGSPVLQYQWFFNGNAVGGATNALFCLSALSPAQSGVYTVVVQNEAGAITSAPAMLQVIAPVERRPVPAIGLIGDAGSLLNLDYAGSIAPVPNWLLLDTVSLVSTSQLYFDISAPLAQQRFYRTWQTGTPVLTPSLSLVSLVPAINLTGNIGDHLRLDYINQIGPIDAWTTLDTIALTNTSQLYFDVTSIGQPPRLYRIVPLP